MKTEPKLKACPFCGRIPKPRKASDGWMVYCREEAGIGKEYVLWGVSVSGTTKARAIAAWNRRTP